MRMPPCAASGFRHTRATQNDAGAAPPMAKLRDHKPVGEDYLAGATIRANHAFAVPASAVWAALLDAQAWTQWLPITGVTWTSPRPFGVGTTRTVDIGKQSVQEYFFAWEDGRRMAFNFTRSTLPLSAAVEDYQVIPTADGCELRWTGRASGFPLGWLIARSLGSGIRKGLPKLEALIKAEPKRFGL